MALFESQVYLWQFYIKKNSNVPHSYNWMHW